MNKNNRLTTLALPLIIGSSLAGCAALPGKVPPRPSKYGVQNEAPRYGDWFIEPNTCKVETAGQDFIMSTDGGITRTGLLPIKLTFNLPLAGVPRTTLTGIPVPIPQEGANKHYTIFLEYSPRSVADLWYDGNFITLTYQPLGETQPREAYLQTRGLIDALAHLKENCR